MSCEVWFYVMFFLNVNPPLQFYLHSYVSIFHGPGSHIPCYQHMDAHGGKGRFTHETESPSSIHFKHSHWWKRWRWFKFASHYNIWGTNKVYEGKMDIKSTWIPTWHQMDHVSLSLGLNPQKPPLGGGPNTKLGDLGIPNLRTTDLFYFIMYKKPHNRNSLN